MAAVAALSLVLAACAPSELEEGGSGLNRYVDEEFGVVCYQRYASSAPLSCVVVDRGLGR